jgi:hypothetical protein
LSSASIDGTWVASMESASINRSSAVSGTRICSSKILPRR